MEEIWKDIKGYEGLYQASNLGRIKSIPRKGTSKNEKILKLQNKQDGYARILLYKNNVCKNKLVHRLIAETFIPNPNNYKEINHKDENKKNNNINNLEWCTRSYNIKYGRGQKLRIKKHCKKILQYSKEGNFIKEWESKREAEKQLNIYIHNNRKTAGGYVWKF